jgi:predicted nucleic acid-binding protein
MAEVVLDANVLVGLLDAGDVHHARARALVDRLRADGHSTVLLDVLVGEAVSVLCRRQQRLRAYLECGILEHGFARAVNFTAVETSYTQ